MIRLRALLALAAVCTAASISAQAPRTAAPITIHGRVMAQDTGQPLTNARVVVSGSSVAVRTDLEGRFTVAAVPSAVLAVVKAGYVRTEVTRDAAPVITLVRAVAISGRVTNERGEPVSGVSVVAATRDKLDAPLRTLPTATTDDRGDYRIGGLPSGTYVVSARTSGSTIVSVSLPNNVAAFSVRQSTTYFADANEAKAATPVTLDAGTERADIDFHVAAANTSPDADVLAMALERMEQQSRLAGVTQEPGSASIRGSILGNDGRPLARATVAVFRRAPRIATRTTTTDEAGSYELSELPPGEYRVAAALPGYVMPPDPRPATNPIEGAGPEFTLADGEHRTSEDVTMLRMGSISGRILDDVGEPIQGAIVGVMVTRYEGGRRRLVVAKPTSRVTDDRGEFRIFGVPPGQYVLAASVGDILSADLPGYVPTYFPGTSVAATAQFIGVSAGEDVGGIDVPLAAAATASISGRVLDASGKPWGGMFVLVPRSPISARIGARIEPDGTFEFRNVAPGRYVIQAERPGQGAGGEGEFAAQEVTVAGSDLTNLRIQLSVGSRIAGRVTFEGALDTGPAPASVNISPIPADFDLAPHNLPTAEPDKSYAFELRGIHGDRRLQVTKMPAGWTVKSILSNGRNIADELLRFGRANQSLDDVEVVLTNRINAITGSVADNGGRTAGAARVMAFAIDRERWYPASRFMKSVLTSTDGTYRIEGLPTGSYFVVATADPRAAGDAWGDPQLLDSLRPAARIISLGDGQTQTVNLRVR